MADGAACPRCATKVRSWHALPPMKTRRPPPSHPSALLKNRADIGPRTSRVLPRSAPKCRKSSGWAAHIVIPLMMLRPPSRTRDPGGPTADKRMDRVGPGVGLGVYPQVKTGWSSSSCKTAGMWNERVDGREARHRSSAEGSRVVGSSAQTVGKETKTRPDSGADADGIRAHSTSTECNKPPPSHSFAEGPSLPGRGGRASLSPRKRRGRLDVAGLGHAHPFCRARLDHGAPFRR